MRLPKGYTAKSVATIRPTERAAGAGDTMWELLREDGSVVTNSGHVARIEAAASADWQRTQDAKRTAAAAALQAKIEADPFHGLDS